MRHTGFSIIMPTYNLAAFIRMAIASVQWQTYSEWELIIVNDGANDDTEIYIRLPALNNSTSTLITGKL